MTPPPQLFIFFFFNDTATTEIYTLSLHDALPISVRLVFEITPTFLDAARKAPPVIPDSTPNKRLPGRATTPRKGDRKSTRLNSSHSQISYAVFCLKKKKKKKRTLHQTTDTTTTAV